MFSFKTFEEYETAGLIRSQVSYDGSLSIYNYTEHTAFEHKWDEVTLACRGLIIDNHEARVVARPFQKFFNLGEYRPDEIPVGQAFVVQEKVDGSLIITTLHNGELVVASRGSFQSDQAQHARDILEEAYPDWRPPEGWTVLFEVIYPDNRIVVNYHGVDDLILLGAVENATGAEWALDELASLGYPGPTADRYTMTLPEIARTTADPLNGDNREGFVLVYPRVGEPSFRVKVKFAQYVQLHKVVTGLSTKTVWEALSTGTWAALVEIVPDEWFHYIRDEAERLTADFNDVADALGEDYEQIPFGENITRKDQAAIVLTLRNSGLLFSMLDGKPIEGKIWKLIEPEWRPLSSSGALTSDAA